jgi:hypothetical protein
MRTGTLITTIRKPATILVLALTIILSGIVVRQAAAAEDIAKPAASTAESALRQAIEMTGAAYAGDCAGTRSPDDAGKICSKFVAERAGVRAYLTGRTFSEFDQWVFVQQAPDGWRPAGTAPQGFFASPQDIPWPAP